MRNVLQDDRYYGRNDMVYPGREQHLELLLRGLQKTNIPLIEFDGTQLLPAAMADDIGIYILIPKIASLLSIDIKTTIAFFFPSLMFLACCFNIWGFINLFRSWQARSIAIAGSLLLAKISLTSMDVYCAPAALALALTPWTLYYLQKEISFGSHIFFLLAGLACALSHYIRGHSGTAFLLFIGVLLILNDKFSLRDKIISLGILVLGFAIVFSYFTTCLYQYQTFIHENLPQYAWVQPHHPFWHTIYAGLGFISNDLNLAFNDTAPGERVFAIDPTFKTSTSAGQWDIPLSHQKYEAILRNEVLHLMKNHTFYIIRVLVAKIGLLLFYLLLFANLGIFFVSCLPSTFIAAFGVALCWSALPGLLAIPNFLYLTGYTTLAGLVGLISLGMAIERDRRYVRDTLTHKYQTLKSKFSAIS